MADKDFISKVFQRATEEFDIEFNPNAWARMEQKLDRARRRRVLFFWMRWGIGVVVALLLAGLLWQNLVSKEIAPPVTKPEMPVVEAPGLPEEPCIEQEAIANQMPVVKNKLEEPALVAVQKALSENKTSDAALLTHSKNAFTKAAKQVDIPEETSAIANAQPEIPAETKRSIANASTENIAGIVLSELESQKPEEIIRPVNQAIPEPSDPMLTDRTRQSPWTLGLSFAPEAVSVGFNEPPRSGLSFGILAEYRFARRFSLSAQGVYAKKSYLAGKGAFHRPGGWLYDLEPTETSGNCNMLEATLALRSELLQRQSWKLVAHTGVSTWWMLREGYHYEYEYHYPGLIYNWQSNKALTEWLAMAQVGIGTEIKLSRKLSAQADFYLQIPLQGVGRGSVQLYSQGLSLSLRRGF